MGGMRQGFGVRQSVPYGLAAVVNNEMRANSMTSLSTDKSLANPDGKCADIMTSLLVIYDVILYHDIILYHL